MDVALPNLDIKIEQCQQLEPVLTSTEDGSKDLDSKQLFDEIKSFQALISNDGEEMDVRISE